MLIFLVVRLSVVMLYSYFAFGLVMLGGEIVGMLGAAVQVLCRFLEAECPAFPEIIRRAGRHERPIAA